MNLLTIFVCICIYIENVQMEILFWGLNSKNNHSLAMFCSNKQANLDNAPNMPWEKSFYLLLCQSHFMTMNSHQTICFATVAFQHLSYLASHLSQLVLSAETGTREVGNAWVGINTKAKRHFSSLWVFNFIVYGDNWKLIWGFGRVYKSLD